MILAGDVGGTKTDIAVYSPEAGVRAPVADASFPSGDYPSLEAIAREFLTRVDGPVTCAAFAVAGPVLEGRARITNLPWVIDEEALRGALGLQGVRLLNDLEALARAVPHLEGDDLHLLKEGTPVAGGAIAVIAPGTGLGEGYLTWNGTRYEPHPSEGGHADFAATTPLQIDLLRYLQERHEHVSYEMVCSGLGIANIYNFLRDSGYAPEPPEFAARLAAAEDRTPLIATAALDPEAPLPLAVATLETFVAILGAEAGNLALKVLATGGVYVGAGIPRRMLAALKAGGFLKAFEAKGRMREIMSRMPVNVIMSRAALMGAAYVGLEMECPPPAP
jgi:glucokinase